MNPERPIEFDEVKLYDEAIIDKFTFVLESKAIPTVMNTAQRPHASAQTRLGASKRNDRVVLPSASLTRKTFPLNPKGGFARRRMIVGYTDESKTRVKVARPPRPTSFTYDFQCLLATPNDMNVVLKQYWRLFIQDKTVLEVNIPEWTEAFWPLVTTSHPVTDATQIDPLTGDRVFEIKSSLTLEGYIFSEITVEPCVGPRLNVTFEEY